MLLLALTTCLVLNKQAFGPPRPWVTIEAEQMTTTGRITSDDAAWQPASEASGRKCVQLQPLHGTLTWLVPNRYAPGKETGIVIRYRLSVGLPLDDTLAVLVNGKPAGAFVITNRYSHQYGAYPFTKNFGDGAHRHYWDESALKVQGLKSGDELTFQWKGSRALYVDLVDFESLAPAVLAPPNAISLADYGVGPDESRDVSTQLRSAIADASAKARPLYIPPGTYHVRGTFNLDQVRIVGAGMWRTYLIPDLGPGAERVTLLGAGNNITVEGLSLRSNVTYRNDSEPNDGVSGSFGTGSVLKDLWIEHSKVGMWLTNSDGLRIENCRFRDTIADGINLCLGMHATEVRNCFARGTGDDCFAMWPASYAPAKFEHAENVFRDCVAEMPYLAHGFAVYGGRDQLVQGCDARQIPSEAAYYASTTFPTLSGFSGVQTFRLDTVEGFHSPAPAFGLFADKLDLPKIRIESVLIRDVNGPSFDLRSANSFRISDLSLRSVRAQKEDQRVVPVLQVAEHCHGNARVSMAEDHVKVIKSPASDFEIVWGNHE